MHSKLVEEFHKKFVAPGCSLSKYIPERRSWVRMSSTPVTKDLILSHFEGGGIYGQVLDRSSRNYFCIDLDKNKLETDSNFLRRAKFIRESIFCPSIALTSSTSNNIHCYFFLRNCNPSILKQRVLQHLINLNINPAPGFVEVYGSCGDNLRLPFGEGSCMLSNSLDRPVSTSKEDQIRKFVEFLYCTSLPDMYTALPHIKGFTKKTNICSSPVDVTELLNNGIQEYGTRNSSMLKLALFLAKNGGSSEYIHDQLLEFVFTDRYDHKSKDIHSNRSKVEKDAKSISKWAVKSAEREVVTPSNLEIPLDLGLCEYVLDRFGPDVYSIKTQNSVFKLLQYVKRRVLLYGEDNVFSLSKSLLLSFGLSSTNYRAIISALQEDSILKVISLGNAVRGHSTKYKYLNTFCVKPQEGYNSYYEFLLNLGHLEDGTFSRYRVGRIKKELRAGW